MSGYEVTTGYVNGSRCFKLESPAGMIDELQNELMNVSDLELF